MPKAGKIVLFGIVAIVLIALNAVAILKKDDDLSITAIVVDTIVSLASVAYAIFGAG